MRSRLARSLACALSILPLIWLSDSHCSPASANSLGVIRPHHSQEKTLGERVSLFDGRILFSPPAEFAQMTGELIAKKFPDYHLPGVAFTRADTKVSVLIGFAEERSLRPEQLPKFQEFMISSLEGAMPGFRLLTKDFVEIDGRSWIHLEYLSRREGNSEVHNDIYATSLENRILLFNFNSVTSEYEKSKVALQRSKDSIVVKAIVE